jgi:hypothetical protein
MRTRDKLQHLRWLIPALALAFLLIQGCGGKKEEAAPKATAPAPAPPPAVVEAPREKPVYLYSGDKFRDPFTPAGQTNNYQADAIFDPGRASVKAIIYGGAHRGAVLSAGGSASYFVKDGRIFDVMGKTVEGFTAKIFVDKVIVLGEADTAFELKIRNDEEEKS